MEKGKIKLLRVTEVMEVLRCSRDFVDRLMASGKLTRIQIGEKAVRISEADLTRFINSRRQ